LSSLHKRMRLAESMLTVFAAYWSPRYSVGTPDCFRDRTFMIEARADGGRIVRAVVRRRAWGRAGRGSAAARSEAGCSVEECGPRLSSRFGAGIWRRNVALVQSTPDAFAEPMSAEAEYIDPAPADKLDLSRAAYRVGANVVALLVQ
jgi:hypothetical protein